MIQLWSCFQLGTTTWMEIQTIQCNMLATWTLQNRSETEEWGDCWLERMNLLNWLSLTCFPLYSTLFVPSINTTIIPEINKSEIEIAFVNNIKKHISTWLFVFAIYFCINMFNDILFVTFFFVFKFILVNLILNNIQGFNFYVTILIRSIKNICIKSKNA